MIDFSQYPEESPFKIAVTNENAFLIESPFDEKRLRYVFELREANKTAYRYFEEIEPDWVIEVARKADKVFDFFSDFATYVQRVKTLVPYEYAYKEALEDGWEVMRQIFYKIGTPYQLFGYFDHQVNLHTSGAIDNATFVQRIQTGIQDLNTILDPLLSLLYYIEIGSKLMQSSWSHLNPNDELDSLMASYGRTLISANIDDRFEAVGTSLQVSAEFFGNQLANDNSNVEMIMAKTIKISLDSYNLKQKLEALNFYTPSYP